MKRLVRIEMCRETEKSVYMSVSPSDNVLSIKQRLESLTGIPVLSQTLYLAATQLTDSTSLNEFSISPVTNLNLHIPIRGGACRYPTDNPLEFVEQSQAQLMENFALDQMQWHSTVKQGVNIVTRCGNRMCELGAANSDIILQKENYAEHLGYCSVRSQLLNMNCPLCGGKIQRENFKCFVFVDCVVSVEWRMKDGGDNNTELSAEGDLYQILRLTPGATPYEYIDLRIKFN